jgi:hypothetical protein
MKVDPSGIQNAKRRLPLPALLRALGFNPPVAGIGNMPSPFAARRRQKSPSCSLYRRGESWRWCDRTGGREIKGDEITLLERLENLSRKDAIARYLTLAGQRNTTATSFPSRPKSLLADKAIDWLAAVGNFNETHAKWLSEWRGYSSEFVDWLKRQNLIGVYRGNFALPVHDHHGGI